MNIREILESLEQELYEHNQFEDMMRDHARGRFWEEDEDYNEDIDW